MIKTSKDWFANCLYCCPSTAAEFVTFTAYITSGLQGILCNSTALKRPPWLVAVTREIIFTKNYISGSKNFHSLIQLNLMVISHLKGNCYSKGIFDYKSLTCASLLSQITYLFLIYPTHNVHHVERCTSNHLLPTAKTTRTSFGVVPDHNICRNNIQLLLMLGKCQV